MQYAICVLVGIPFTMRKAMPHAICVSAFQAGSGIPFTMRNAMQYAICVLAFQARVGCPKGYHIYNPI